MKIKKIYKPVCLLGLMTVTATSCEDWLTLYPQDRVVEENFWEDKNDLEGVRYGAYKQMCATIEKFAIWGDLRSDAYKINPVDDDDQKYRDDFTDIIQGMPDSSMTYFDWSGVYTTINYCNKVLQHGEEVLAKDKQFTTSEWLQMRAEMTGLRALNYFYLLRAFKDIPYTTKVVNTDEEVEEFPLTMQMDVLDSIILDCEKVKGQARNRFTSTADSKGMITNSAIYAMLSDMYLWRASLHQGRGLNNDTVRVGATLVAHTPKDDYQKAVDYADLALSSLATQTEAANTGYNRTISEKENYGLTNCNMIANDFAGANSGAQPEMNVEDLIFTQGNSDESIFELQFNTSDSRQNTTVSLMYGYTDGTHLAVSEDAMGAVFGGLSSTAGKYDTRTWIGCNNKLKGMAGSALSGYYCMKYQSPVVVISTTSDKEVSLDISKSNAYSNWIIYRMTDVMLMKAEALACLAAWNVNKDANNKLCQQYVNAIHRRNYCDLKDGNVPSTDVTVSSTVKYGDAVSTGSDYVKLVMNERLAELIGEGKRWFDLVRYAERNAGGMDGTVDEREWTEALPIGNGQTGMRKMVDDYLKTTYSSLYTTLKNRFKNRYGMYCPIYYMEVKASNGAITQNPVWNKSKYDN